MSVKNMLSQIVFYRHISPSFLYSQCLGWRRREDAVANHFLQSHIPPFFLLFNAVSA